MSTVLPSSENKSCGDSSCILELKNMKGFSPLTSSYNSTQRGSKIRDVAWSHSALMSQLSSGILAGLGISRKLRPRGGNQAVMCQLLYP
ncbi:hypothetical protein INR49_027077 [Caranx melampygus]|nr:hypothetical protein INR49_027077 [Caranx melampygus]